MAKKKTQSSTKTTANSKSQPATAKKAAAPKKKVATAKKAAPAKAGASARTAPAAKPSSNAAQPAARQPEPATTISAKVDIGFGNMLYIRGEGPGLNWNRGVPMDCVAADEWTWSTKSANSPFSCKVLINDEIWSTGEDFVVPPGERLVCYPSF